MRSLRGYRDAFASDVLLTVLSRKGVKGLLGPMKERVYEGMMHLRFSNDRFELEIH